MKDLTKGKTLPLIMGFAIPITSVKSIISNLETKTTRQKLAADKQGYLGITSKYDVTSDISEA